MIHPRIELAGSHGTGSAGQDRTQEPLRFSIALCTYNGARYLAEQLESIARQTRQPDELVICDDRSSDQTLDIIKAFATRAPFAVNYSVNAANLRSTANFAQAISRCTGDVIALADQDDVWLPHKLQTLEQRFHGSESPGFVFSDAAVVDQDLQPLGYTMWEAIGFSSPRQSQLMSEQGVKLLLRRYVVTGATMAFRSTYRDLVLPIPPCWIHDGWIALLIRAVARCAWVSEPLIQYRQHVSQQIGGKKLNLYQQYRVAKRMGLADYQIEKQRFSLAMQRLAEQAQYPIPPWVLQSLQEKINHFAARERMRAGGWRLPTIAGELVTGRYRRYSLGWKSLAQDLFI